VVLKACFIHMTCKTARGMHLLTLYRYNVDYTLMICDLIVPFHGPTEALPAALVLAKAFSLRSAVQHASPN